MNWSSSAGGNPEEAEGKGESPFQSLLSQGATSEETDWRSAFELPLSDAKPIPEAPRQVGDLNPIFPDRIAEEFSQRGYGDTCAIRCQEVILHKYGFDVDENTLIHQAIVEGLYHPGQATLPQDVGKLLEKDYGIPVHQYQHADTSNLLVELAQGHEVMIGVNSTELRHPLLSEIAQVLHIGNADHILILSGIDTHDPDHYQVIVTDPSSGEAAARYPLEKFVSAWRDSNFFMAATTEPPPQDLHLPEMEHFDYDIGHIEEVAGMPYEEFLKYADHPDDVAQMLEQYHETGADKDHGEYLHSNSGMSASYESEQGTNSDTSDDLIHHPLGVDDDLSHPADDYGDIHDETYSDNGLGHGDGHLDIHD